METLLTRQRITLSQPVQRILAGLLFVFLVALLAVGIHAVMAGNTVGMDLHTFYLAARNVFVDHESPYAENVAVESQLSVLRRLATENDDQMAFVYPPYSLLPLAPLAGLPFDWAQAIWMAFFIVGSVSAMLLVFPRRPLLPAMGVLLFYPFTFGIILGNFVNLVALVILVAISKVMIGSKPPKKWQIFFGIFLAWATIKPQFFWLYLICILLASLKKRLWPLMISFGISLVGFFGISFLLVPNWPVLWLARVAKHVGYISKFPNITLFLNELRNPADARTLTIALIALFVGVTAWALLSWWKGRLSTLVLLAWVGIATYLIHPRNFAYAQIAFLIPLLVWAQTQKSQRSLPVILFYWGALILSWGIFFLGKSASAGPLVEEWGLVAGCAWMFWLLVWPPAGQIQTPLNSRPV
ncbi:predicted membrane protein [Longilinea arvoryzae]|uniref:Predicted membrane protein n=1 Tax=Longilinea arvoryzae TaxID=360412 RepID=A0A0S7BC19_9CHLR|nr:glycosyltransferase 87 family protein [Longilinea arvoryzae]GAP15262.1 predicted membrane protein [Longilinea arvoryzae]